MRVLLVLCVAVGVACASGAAGAGSRAASLDLLYQAGSAIFVSTQDGGGQRLVSGNVGTAQSPSWSPDGLWVAFSSTRDANSSRLSDIYVARPDGSSLRRLTFDSLPDAARAFPAWSPDGASIAYLSNTAAGLDVWTVPVVGGPARRLTASGGEKSGLAWSPDGSALLTAQAGPNGYVVEKIDPTTGIETTLTEASLPVWSPDGRRIAYVDKQRRVAVAQSDGSGSRELTSLISDSPVWSPDGTRVLFSAEIAETSMPTRFGYVTRQDLYTAPADASAPPRRLTGPFDSLVVPGTRLEEAQLSPDGALISYIVDRTTIWLMNADGSCAHPLPPLSNITAGPYWRPGSVTGGPLSCVDLQAHALIDAGPHTLGWRTRVVVTVENHGNEDAHNVALHVTPVTLASTINGCPSSVRSGEECLLGTIPPATSRTVDLDLSSASAGKPGLSYSVTTTDLDLVPGDTSGTVSTTVFPCTILGSAFADHLDGTPGPDRICGLVGPDWINGGPGDDYIDGGRGNDFIIGGPGHDTILGGSGYDTINARDGEPDTIDCGPGADHAIVDRLDRVRNCETVDL